MKEIEKLRGQNKQLREAAALVAKESAELLERRWVPVEERLPEPPEVEPIEEAKEMHHET